MEDSLNMCFWQYLKLDTANIWHLSLENIVPSKAKMNIFMHCGTAEILKIALNPL